MFLLRLRNFMTRARLIAASQTPAAMATLVAGLHNEKLLLAAGRIYRNFQRPAVQRALLVLGGLTAAGMTTWAVANTLMWLFGDADETPEATLDPIFDQLGISPDSPASSLTDDQMRSLALLIGQKYDLTAGEVDAVLDAIRTDASLDSETVGSVVTGAGALGASASGPAQLPPGSLESYATEIDNVADAAMLVATRVGAPEAEIPTLIAALRLLLNASPLVLSKAISTMTRNDFGRRRRF